MLMREGAAIRGRATEGVTREQKMTLGTSTRLLALG